MKNKIFHRCFDNNLQKLFRTKILKNSNKKILLIVVLMVRLRLKLQMDIVKMIPSLLVFHSLIIFTRLYSFCFYTENYFLRYTGIVYLTLLTLNKWINKKIKVPPLHVSIWILRTVTYPSAETGPGPSQATKINLFARIVSLRISLAVFVKSQIMEIWRGLIKSLTCSNTGN